MSENSDLISDPLNSFGDNTTTNVSLDPSAAPFIPGSSSLSTAKLNTLSSSQHSNSTIKPSPDSNSNNNNNPWKDFDPGPQPDFASNDIDPSSPKEKSYTQENDPNLAPNHSLNDDSHELPDPISDNNAQLVEDNHSDQDHSNHNNEPNTSDINNNELENEGKVEDDDDEEEEEEFRYEPSYIASTSNNEPINSISEPLSISSSNSSISSNNIIESNTGSVPNTNDNNNNNVHVDIDNVNSNNNITSPSNPDISSSAISTTPTAAFPTPISSAVDDNDSSHEGSQVRLGDTSISSTNDDINISMSSSAIDAPSLYRVIVQECKSGNLEKLRTLFYPPASNPDPNQPAPFTLSNTPDPHTSLTPLHYAVSRGNLSIAKFLLEECGAIVDMEDSSGETALHKAAYAGHAPLVKLLSTQGDKQASEMPDSDGWTPLHNAASKGWLDVVRMLIEDVGVTVDKQSKNGYTPLMNASSKGHLPVVRYLLAKHVCNPFVRNLHGETAYDVAVMSLEMNIADVLSNYEALFWSSAAPSPDLPYNPISLHLSLAVVLHENQRLDLRLKTLARTLANGQQLKFSPKVLSANDARAPYGMPPTFKGLNDSQFERPAFRSDIGLPTISSPFQIQLPPSPNDPGPSKAQKSLLALSSSSSDPQQSSTSSSSTSNDPTITITSAADSNDNDNDVNNNNNNNNNHSDQNQNSHFWLSDWFVDLTAPYVDPDEGWQYAKSFDAPPDEWSAEMPPELQHLIDEGGKAPPGQGIKWVRRRRWCRIMRRRLDRPHLGFPEVNYVSTPTYTTSSSQSAPNKYDQSSSLTAKLQQESDSVDYIEHAKYIAGAHRLGFEPDLASSTAGSIHNGITTSASTSTSAAVGGNSQPILSGLTKGQIQKLITTLETAINELRAGLLAEEDETRRHRADALLHEYTERLESAKQESSLKQVSEQEAHDDGDDDGGDDEEESFVYPSATSDGGDEHQGQPQEDALSEPSVEGASILSPPQRTSSIRSGSDYFTFAPMQPEPLAAGTSPLPDLSPQLQRAPDFQVPTHEVQSPRNVVRSQAISARTSSSANVPPWEPDDAANQCRRCQRRFNFFTRKHHCRKCGLVVCGTCSTNQDHLEPHEVVLEPGTLDQDHSSSTDNVKLYRTCDTCHAELAPWQEQNGEYPSESNNNNNRNQAGLGASTSNNLNIAPSSPLGSEVSEFSECPVCGTHLPDIASTKLDRETHLRECLERGGTVANNSRYLVFKLTGGPIVDTECLICFEDFAVGDYIGRLMCLCYFHKRCISAWLNRGHGCPVHSREDS